MDEQLATNLIIELMETAEACYLTTLDNNFPQTRAMLNLRNSSHYPKLKTFFKTQNDHYIVYFTTNTASQKINQIKRNPNVSVYYARPVAWQGLMLGGQIRIISDPDIKNAIWQDNWSMYYPQGKTDADYAILELKPKVLKLYNKLKTFTLNMD